MTDEELPVQRSGAETTADGRRVLGMVPGKPVAGDRKEPDEQDLVMVWPHTISHLWVLRYSCSGVFAVGFVMESASCASE